jgi:class 3 adenylate cyclase/tetratricopeptide (TPR) repeat protein
VPICGKCGEENPERARFCLGCGTALAERPAHTEERKRVSILFCDLVGSTARAEQLDPEDVRAMLTPYYARLRGELERFGGTVEKFIGDAVMCVFGAPVAHEDDPERAVRGALAIRDAIAELNEADPWLDLRIRVGVNTGEALVVVNARASEGEGMVAGDVVNTAARLQSNAPVNSILVGAETYAATSAVIEYRAAEPISAKGKAEPVPVWEVVGTRERPAVPGARGPLVGRMREIVGLAATWESVLSDSVPRLVTVVGPAGIGKSRLLAELIERTRETGIVHYGRCLPYGEGITYWPIAEMLKDAAGIDRSDTAEAASARLGALIESLPTDDSDQLRTIAAALAHLVGLPTTPRARYSTTAISQAELHWGIRRTLELLAEERPRLIVVEDLHWAEPTLLELLRFLVDGARVPVLVIGSARPELREASPAFLAGSDVVPLDALSDEASEALLEGLLGTEELPDETRSALLQNAAGNPLFLEETIRMLVDAGPEAVAAEALPVPTSLWSLIASRLDQLPELEKRVALHASVVGHVFWPGAVAALDGDDRDAVAAAIGGLESRDLVRARESTSMAGEREFAFKHILIRDVAYGQLPKGRRAALHVRFADWTIALPRAEEDFVEIPAYHLEQACRLAREVAHSPVAPPVDRAVEALSRAAEKAERHEGFREADRFYARALALVDGDRAEMAAELRLRRGQMQVALGDLRNAQRLLSEVADETTDAGRRDLRCAALLSLANIDWKQGRAADMRERLTEAEALAVEVDDGRLQVRGAFERAKVHSWFKGEDSAAVAALRRAVALAEELDDGALRIEGHLRLGSLLINVGELARAEEELELAAALAGKLASRRDETRAAYFLGVTRYYLGKVDEAEQLALDVARWLERTGDSFLRVQNFRMLAKYALARDDPAAAEQWLRDAVPLALESGGWLVIEIYRYLTESLVRQGRLDEARELVAFASRDLPEEDLYARAALLLARATVAAAADEGSAATTSFEEALRLLEEQHLWTDLAEARVAFAQALRAVGEPTIARTELERARVTFRRMEARGLVEQIDRELEALRVTG